jgi:UDP-glucuronate 4-epimerase
MSILVTGAAGFIGFHTAGRLLDTGHQVVGTDNLNPDSGIGLKEARLSILNSHRGFMFRKANLQDRDAIAGIFADTQPTTVIHLGAQTGVRQSIDNPHIYIESNIVGFLNVLEGCRRSGVGHLVFASSSSVYGVNTKMPFSIMDNVDHPISLYAATKKSNELMAFNYSYLFGIPTTGLRLFTVYGPWGRPDMAAFIFTKAILENKPIDVFNEGRVKRDFTYVDDIVESILRVAGQPPQPGSGDIPNGLQALYRIYNVGNREPVELNSFISTLETCIGKKAIKNMMPMQAGDVPATCADVSELLSATGFAPSTQLETGLSRFVDWYREYYG